MHTRLGNVDLCICYLKRLHDLDKGNMLISSAFIINTKLEIWGKAQREFTQHLKFDWGDNLRGELLPVAKSHARTQTH